MASLAQGADVGTATWGIQLTAAEEAKLDLVGRMTFVDELDGAVLPYLRSLPILAGYWVDQVSNGGLVVALTALDLSVEQQVREFMPADSRGLAFRLAKYDLKSLTAAADAARDVWAQAAPGLPLLSVSVDTIGNGVQLGVAPSNVTSAQAPVTSVQSKLGVPVSIVADQGGYDATCNIRTNCVSPMKAGAQIANGSPGNWWCTMGFHIAMNAGGSRQFLTAGHCGYQTSKYWYQAVYAGVQAATWYVRNGEDVMRVDFGADAQASPLVFDEDNAYMSSPSAPMLNETICGSMGFGDVIDCGTVSSTHFSWTSEHCGCGVWGARDSGITPIPGDSGSPLYRKVLVLGEYYIMVPVGIVDHQNGGFAIVTDALAHWGATIIE